MVALWTNFGYVGASKETDDDVVSNMGNYRISSIRGGPAPSPMRNESDGATVAGDTSRSASAEKTSDGRIIHDWNGPDDPDNPFNWNLQYKWYGISGSDREQRHILIPF